MLSMFYYYFIFVLLMFYIYLCHEYHLYQLYIVMAIVKSTIQVEGTVGGMTFYTRRGSDKIIARSKGGASKQTIKSSPKFEGFRLQQNEWKGCTLFASKLRFAFGGLHRIADYNLTPALNAFAKNLQKTDVTNEIGKRSILLSSYRYTLDGFNFNRNYPFNTVLRVSPVVNIEREKLHATVKIPRINTVVDLLNVQRLPYFRLLVSLGAISDVIYEENSKTYVPINDKMHGISEVYTGEWMLSENILSEQIIEVSLSEKLRTVITDDVTLVVSMAVEFGKVGFTGQAQEVKYAGSGKVVFSL